ncbi:imidazole glycerol phosphate synthase subunit HisF [Candidatus Bathyarchaeota archaeon RBG_13_38_9]|nr:MAG: imidazole glycerol phosphate synthase subunit HisF [Candidatus Bathyarchaeota archaeon RBG_13_38_9]
MLAKRIIPCLDVREGRVVKGVQFVNLKDEGDPAELAQAYGREGADEVVFLDITASHEKRKILLDTVRRTAETLFIPFTVGGGILSIDDIRDVLDSGADKVSINTAAVKEPNLIKKSADAFGSQCIVVAIDAKRVYKINEGKTIVETSEGLCWWEVYLEGGRVPTGIDAIEWAKRVEELEGGEILLTSMDCDGTQSGYDISLTREISESTNIPIIASGGAGKPEHIVQVFIEGKADAALAASIFHRGTHPISEVKSYITKKGIPVRL